jgi:acyl carrier protein
MAAAQEVRDLLRSRVLRASDGIGLPDDLRLGPGGLGLDSIALVELLLECEQRFGEPLAAELLVGEPLTIGRLVERIDRGRAKTGT